MAKFDLVATLTVSDADRFWLYVDVRGEDECWPWKAFCNKDGYGKFGLSGGSELAHRIGYLLQYGKIDPDLEVCHNCNNPTCQNGFHLRQDTHKGNLRDMIGNGTQVLTQDKVNYIRSALPKGVRYSKKQYEVLAQELELSWKTIQKVVQHSRWKES